MTIAVTAASGKLGSEIIQAVSRLGTHSFVGLARTPAKDAGVRGLVYTSVQGSETRTAFSPIVQSNR